MKSKIEINSTVYTHRILSSTVCVLKEAAEDAANDVIGFHFNLTAMSFLYFTLESYLNYLGESIAPDLWDTEKEFFRKRPYVETMGKLDYLIERCNLNIDKAIRPYQTVKQLHKIRIYLVHGKTDKNKVYVEQKHVRQRADNKLPYAMKSFLEKHITREGRNKAILDIERIIRDLHLAALNNFPHQELSQDPLIGLLSSSAVADDTNSKC